MKTIKKYLYEKAEYHYPSIDFIPYFKGYLHPVGKRPAIIVVPGGGYSVVAPTEGERVAKKFYNLGYQVFVLAYTTNSMELKPLIWQPAEDLARALLMVRRNAETFGVKDNQITVCGFSAGGHLSGTLGVHYGRPELQKLLEKGEPAEMIRPDALLLCYPVITAGEYCHRSSFARLLGENATDRQVKLFGLESHVNTFSPPTFLWHTMTDEEVSCENSILFAKECKDNKVTCELHLFPVGPHGMSTADEEWANKGFEDDLDSLYQLYDAIKLIKQTDPDKLPPKYKMIQTDSFSNFLKIFVENHQTDQKKTPDKEVSF